MLVTVNVKTLSNELFTIDIDDEITVKEMKEKINELKGDNFRAANQKLIAQGRIMNDEEKVKTYDLQNVKFVVIMISKPAAPPQPAAGASSSESTASAASKASEVPKEAPRDSPTPARPNNPTPNAASAASGESVVVTGEAYEQMVQKLAEMGYPQDQIASALRASYNNMERAVEYLVNGLPPVAEAPASGGQQAAPAGNEGSAGGLEGGLSFLRNQAQFQQMRHAIRNDPQLLTSICQQLGNANPDLLRLITENQEEFMQLLNEEPGEDVEVGRLVEGAAEEAPAAGGNLVIQAQVTPQDREAIERLKALGFPEHLVVEAYLVCDKNEDLAVNFLLQDD